MYARVVENEFDIFILPVHDNMATTSHEEVRQRSLRVLQSARQFHAKKSGYNSDKTRNEMASLFRARSGGTSPYIWQLDVAEGIHLGVGGLTIAVTGSGKTIPYMLPLLLAENSAKVLVVISPLKALQREQVNEICGFFRNKSAHTLI